MRRTAGNRAMIARMASVEPDSSLDRRPILIAVATVGKSTSPRPGGGTGVHTENQQVGLWVGAVGDTLVVVGAERLRWRPRKRLGTRGSKGSPLAETDKPLRPGEYRSEEFK